MSDPATGKPTFRECDLGQALNFCRGWHEKKIAARAWRALGRPKCTNEKGYLFQKDQSVRDLVITTSTNSRGFAMHRSVAA